MGKPIKTYICSSSTYISKQHKTQQRLASIIKAITISQKWWQYKHGQTEQSKSQ